MNLSQEHVYSLVSSVAFISNYIQDNSSPGGGPLLLRGLENASTQPLQVTCLLLATAKPSSVLIYRQQDCQRSSPTNYRG